jgi:hypothetical protein
MMDLAKDVSIELFIHGSFIQSDRKGMRTLESITSVRSPARGK